MTKDELYENAQYLDVADIMTLFECGGGTRQKQLFV